MMQPKGATARGGAGNTPQGGLTEGVKRSGLPLLLSLINLVPFLARYNNDYRHRRKHEARADVWRLCVARLRQPAEAAVLVIMALPP